MARVCDIQPRDSRKVCVLYRARSFEPVGRAMLVVPEEAVAVHFAEPYWQWCWSFEPAPVSSRRGEPSGVLAL